VACSARYWTGISSAFALGSRSIAFLARVTRSAMLDVLGGDFVRTARAKGLSPGTVALRHALKNALIPFVTIVGLEMGSLLGGLVVVEFGGDVDGHQVGGVS